MTRVALILTGDTEFAALHDSLTRIFPTLTFERHASPPGQPMDGFTSNALTVDEPMLAKQSRDGDELLTPLAKLVDQLILAVHPGRNGEPYDYAVLIDDLELANLSQPERVVEHVRRAVPHRIDFHWPSQAKQNHVRALVRERCSFHLLSPMVESYFFGEPGALDRAGKVVDRPNLVDPSNSDLEQFTVSDPAYEAVAGPLVATKKEAKGDWRRSPDQRPRHPKKYVQYLADPALDGQTRYREATTGRDALKTLDWAQVLQQPRFTRLARSLFADLAQIAHPVEAGFATSDADCSPLTWRYGRADRVLRNI